MARDDWLVGSLAIIYGWFSRYTMMWLQVVYYQTVYVDSRVDDDDDADGNWKEEG